MMRRLLLLLIASALVAPGCGYALAGRGNFLPDYIKIIGIPQFTNQSATADIDRVLTESVLAEFQTHGSFRVQPNVNGVDATLTGIIKNVRLEPQALVNGQASRYAIVVTADVSFTELRDGKVLWSNPTLQFRELYDVTSSVQTNDAAAFLAGNSLAYERLSKNFARHVVTSILENF